MGIVRLTFLCLPTPIAPDAGKTEPMPSVYVYYILRASKTF